MSLLNRENIMFLRTRTISGSGVLQLKEYKTRYSIHNYHIQYNFIAHYLASVCEKWVYLIIRKTQLNQLYSVYYVSRQTERKTNNDVQSPVNILFTIDRNLNKKSCLK